MLHRAVGCFGRRGNPTSPHRTSELNLTSNMARPGLQEVGLPPADSQLPHCYLSSRKGKKLRDIFVVGTPTSVRPDLRPLSLNYFRAICLCKEERSWVMFLLLEVGSRNIAFDSESAICRGRVSNNGNHTKFLCLFQRQIAPVIIANQQAEARPRRDPASNN